MSQPDRTDGTVITPQLLRGWPLPDVDEEATKHDRGTVLIVGGASRTPGALLLAGLGALRAGAGRLQVLTVEATAVALAVALPEAAVVGGPACASGSLSAASAATVNELADESTTVVLGPGLLDKDEARELVTAVLPDLTAHRLVVDALGLIGLAGRPELLQGREVVLTPNSGELAALLDGADLEGREAARQVAASYGATVATQGWVVDPTGRSWRNQAGGAGLGTSGSGDVLCGLIGGLLARGAAPEQAAVWGQYAHAAAGDRLAVTRGRLGFLARELLDEVPSVLVSLQT